MKTELKHLKYSYRRAFYIRSKQAKLKHVHSFAAMFEKQQNLPIFAKHYSIFEP